MKIAALLDKKGREVKTIRPGSTIEIAIHVLRAEHIGALVVTEGQRVVGLISERDIILSFAKYGADTLRMTVGELMTRSFETCRSDDTVRTVMGRMTRSRVRHLPVMEGDELVGLISIGDVVKHRLDELETETVVLREAYLASR